MRIKHFIEGSSLVSLLRKSAVEFLYFRVRLVRILKESHTYNLIFKWSIRIRIYFKYSFFGKITEAYANDNPAILQKSNFIKWLLQAFRIWTDKAKLYAHKSTIAYHTGEAKKELPSLTVKTFAVFLLVAVLTNMFFFILLNKKINFFGWMMRILFLFIGLAGLSCNASWEGIRKTSYILTLKNNLGKGRA